MISSTADLIRTIASPLDDHARAQAWGALAAWLEHSPLSSPTFAEVDAALAAWPDAARLMATDPYAGPVDTQRTYAWWPSTCERDPGSVALVRHLIAPPDAWSDVGGALLPDSSLRQWTVTASAEWPAPAAKLPELTALHLCAEAPAGWSVATIRRLRSQTQLRRLRVGRPPGLGETDALNTILAACPGLEELHIMSGGTGRSPITLPRPSDRGWQDLRIERCTISSDGWRSLFEDTLAVGAHTFSIAGAALPPDAATTFKAFDKTIHWQRLDLSFCKDRQLLAALLERLPPTLTTLLLNQCSLDSTCISLLRTALRRTRLNHLGLRGSRISAQAASTLLMEAPPELEIFGIRGAPASTGFAETMSKRGDGVGTETPRRSTLADSPWTPFPPGALPTWW